MNAKKQKQGRTRQNKNLSEQSNDENYTVSQKMHQLWNGIAQNYRDRFWWFLAEIFKIL